jgi:MFS family permease
MVSLLLMTIGGVGMYGAAVVLPEVQREFGAARADASFPYTVTLIGFGLGGILMGRLADRFGVMVVALIGPSAWGWLRRASSTPVAPLAMVC